MSWYPGVDRSVVGTNAGSYTGGPAKGVLHTTESGLGSSAIAAFKSSGSWPHFLVDYSGHFWQFIDTSLAARALQHPSGTVETNRDHAIQIEVVGFAAKPTEHPAAQLDALKLIMRWIESTEGVKPTTSVIFKAYPASYGLNNGVRLTSSQWDNYNEWCGHENIPNNDHGDPGAIDINSLLPPKDFKAMFSPNLVLEPIAAYLSYNGGTYLAADSGAFYAFGAPSIGGPNGQPYFAGRHVARLYPGDTTDPEVPDFVGRAAGALIVRSTSNEWYGLFRP